MSLHFNANDLAGRVFGRLTVQNPSEQRIGGEIRWNCQCECGAQVMVRSTFLTSGSTKSCGCLRRERMRTCHATKHGQARDGHVTRTYRIWSGIKRRCLNASCRQFGRYGGRGITVCDAWRTFEGFRADMGDCPQDMEIERINNDGHYEPDNCRWATRKKQTRNTSANRRMTLNGVVRCVTEWAEITGISRKTIDARLRYGWSDERTLTEPVDQRCRSKAANRR